jgi:hypothetical protein
MLKAVPVVVLLLFGMVLLQIVHVKVQWQSASDQLAAPRADPAVSAEWKGSNSTEVRLMEAVPHQLPKHVIKKSEATCNLCSRKWIFIVSAGRSGSTTLMSMINEIPLFKIDGENNGLARQLFNLHKVAAAQKRNMRDRTAWFKRNPSDEVGMRCAMQAYALAFLGEADSFAPHSVIGWKEIRYGTAAELDFMREVFPCAKFIVNTRQNVKAQSRSAFYIHSKPPDLREKNAFMLDWARRQPSNIALTMALEEFSTETFNDMLRFPGVSGCKYLRMLHSNNQSSYTPDKSTAPVIRCAAQALKWSVPAAW